jgi:hypothetical protein
MPTEAYALCPRRPMPSRTSYESSKGYSSKTEISRRQVVAAQNLQSAGLYRQACNTLLPVLERVILIV